MTGIIKAHQLGELAIVRMLDVPSRPIAQSAEALEMAQLRAELGALEQMLSARDDQLAKLSEELASAVAEAFADGKAAGREEAEDRQAERLAILVEAVVSARGDLERQLEAAERMAVLVARECLEKILGENADRTGLMADLVRRQITQVGRDTVVEIAVSQDDFADDDIACQIDPRVSIMRSELAPGSCNIKLHLGEIDAGLSQQWAMLRRALNEGAEKEQSLAC